MYDTLFQYIKRYSTTPLTQTQLELVKDAFTHKHFRRRHLFLQAGNVCKFTAFIVKGAMRQYSVDDKGIEHVIRLYIENWWAVDRESLIKLKPSIYYIDAWEDTDVLLTTAAQFYSISTIPAIAELLRHLDENHAFAYQRRITSAISSSAEERYFELQNTYPEFLQRFPQHIIASYLGISPEYLSRIRKQEMHK
ncbi:MAG TPA: hypothetical protein VKR32_18530 [Puia sp.]|nr:hypothetical protein [Puia sp.]